MFDVQKKKVVKEIPISYGNNRWELLQSGHSVYIATDYKLELLSFNSNNLASAKRSEEKNVTTLIELPNTDASHLNVKWMIPPIPCKKFFCLLMKQKTIED